MGLNSRKAQIIWPIVVIGLAGLILELPFFWRAMKTRKPSDIKVALAFILPQLAVWTDFALDNTGNPSNIGTAIVWVCAITAAVGAAWLYRPLSKNEAMDQAARNTRPGSSYLN